MRKILLFIFLLFLLIGCGRNNVYHTYYGDIDTDTMIAYLDKGSLCYIVKIKQVEDEQAKALGADTLMWVIYYKPVEDTYLIQCIDNYGKGGLKIEFNPLEEDI